MSLFCKNLYNHSYDDYTSLLLHLHHKMASSYVLYSLSDEQFENKTKLNWPNPFQKDDLELDILGTRSVNGILCLISYFQTNTRLVLWNPTAEEFKVIPARTPNPPCSDSGQVTNPPCLDYNLPLSPTTTM